MLTRWTDWIPREGDDARFKPEDLPRFLGKVWFPEDPTAAKRSQREDEPPTQPEAKTNESKSREMP